MADMSIEQNLVQLRARLSGQATAIALEWVEQTGSTNSDLMERLATLDGPYVRIADHQTAGRGRAGRVWWSEPESALMFSLAWPFQVPAHRLTGLPLAVGAIVCEVLRGQGLDARLKWPNDILLDHSKLAGILIESSTTSDSPIVWTVIGIGINLSLRPSLIERIGQPVASMAALGIDRAILLADLFNALALQLQEFARFGLARFTASWNALDLYRGRAVMIVEHGRTVLDGVALGIDDEGRLKVDTGAGIVPVLAGDVSLRPLPPDAGK